MISPRIVILLAVGLLAVAWPSPGISAPQYRRLRPPAFYAVGSYRRLTVGCILSRRSPFQYRAAVLEKRQGKRASVYAPSKIIRSLGAMRQERNKFRRLVARTKKRCAALNASSSESPAEPAVCGNGICGGEEDCRTCPADCGACPICGNNIREAREVCDGADLAGQTCQTQGFISGSLSCRADCRAFATGQCSLCGNNICDRWLNESEQNCLQDCAPPGLQTDHDNDGLPDQWEQYYFNDPDNGVTPASQAGGDDPDGDGLTNLEEFQRRTNPYMKFTYHAADSNDTDWDGLSDGDEVHLYRTNPLNPDSDGDGLLDSEEVLIRFSDPLRKDIWSFTFTDGQGIVHTRTQNGLRVHDDILGNLQVTAFMYFSDTLEARSNEPYIGPNPDPYRNVTAFEELKRGIEHWADAGVTRVGFFWGIERLEDQDGSTPGYQNPYVDQLEEIARRKNIHITYGLMFGLPWYQFFEDPNSASNRFIRYGRAIRELTQYTNSDEFLIEHEWPIRVHLLPAWEAGLFAFDAQSCQRLRDNYALLRAPGVRMNFYLPMLYTYPDGELVGDPPRTAQWNYHSVQNSMFRILLDTFGSDFTPMFNWNQGYYAIGTYVRRRTVPYQQDDWAKKMFVQRELIGSRGVGLMMNTWWPFRGNHGWPYPNVSSYTTYGPAETPTMLSYAFGRDLDKSGFPNLEFDHVYLYPDQYFDLTGIMQAEYQNNGILVSMEPQDYRAKPGTFKRGKYNAMIISVHREDALPLNFSVALRDQYGVEVLPSPDTYLFEVSADRTTAIFSWIPANSRYGLHWITFNVNNGAGLNSTQSVAISVN